MTTIASAVGWLARNPRCWPVALVPALVWVVLAGLAVLVSVRFLEPWLAARLPQIGYGLTSATAWLLTAAAGLLGAWISLLLTPPLSGPALERIVTAVEEDLGAPPRPSQSFLVEAWCGARSVLAGILLVAPILLACLLLDLFVPVLAPLSTALKLFASALGLSWGLLDYPLTLRGMRMRERFALFRRRAPAALGFGVGLAPLFWLPCCQLLSLPVGVAAATLLYDQIRRAEGSLDGDPELLP